MDEQKLIDEFLTEIEKAQSKLINLIKLGLDRGYFTDVELSQLSAQIDFFEELRKAGYDDSLEKYLNGYEEIAQTIFKQASEKGLTGIVQSSLTDLDALIDVKAEELLGKAELYGKQLKTQLFNNIVSGTPIKDILITLSDIPLKDNQLIAAVNTGIAEFERTAIAKVYSESPEQRFKLTGPKDVRTRASCDAVLAYQPEEGFTKEEIDNGAATELVKQHAKEFALSGSELEQALRNPYSFSTCGGFNCRHRFRPSDTAGTTNNEQRTTFTPAKTIKEAEAQVKQIVNGKVDYSGFHNVEYANKFNKTLLELKGQYGGNIENIKTLNNLDYRDEIMMTKRYKKGLIENGKVIGFEETNDLLINGKFFDKFKEQKELDDILARQYKSNWSYSENIEDLTTHEFGHVLTKLTDEINSLVNTKGLDDLTTYAKQSMGESIAELFLKYKKFGQITSEERQLLNKYLRIKI